MCGKERERFSENPSPDFTSLRSSPSGFADKVASVSESFGRVSECKVTKKKIALQKKSRKSYCFSVAVFRKLKMASNSYDILFGFSHPFVTGIVSHSCNCYMLHLCRNNKFRGFQTLTLVSSFKFQVSEVKNKTRKTSKTFSTTN